MFKKMFGNKAKNLYAVMWTGSQLPQEDALNVMMAGAESFAAKNPDFANLYNETKEFNAKMSVANLAVPALMRSDAGMLTQFSGAMKSQGLAKIPSGVKIYKFTFDHDYDAIVVWCVFS